MTGHYYKVFAAGSYGKRLGVSIPKKFGNSVFRNYQKRIIREAFRTEKNNIGQNFDTVILLIKKPEDRLLQKAELNRIFRWLSDISL